MDGSSVNRSSPCTVLPIPNLTLSSPSMTYPNRHFHNLASWFGRVYEGVPVGNPVEPSMLLRLVRDTILRIDMSKY